MCAAQKTKLLKELKDSMLLNYAQLLDAILYDENLESENGHECKRGSDVEHVSLPLKSLVMLQYMEALQKGQRGAMYILADLRRLQVFFPSACHTIRQRPLYKTQLQISPREMIYKMIY